MPFFTLLNRASGWANKVDHCPLNIQQLKDSKLEGIGLSLRSKHKNTFQLDVLILTETFSNENISDSYYKIPEYVTYRKDRKGKVGGGIIMYVNKSIKAKCRMDLESNDTESIWIQICPHKSK